MKTGNQITKSIKNSLLSDKAITLCLELHRANPGMFQQFIDKFERDMALLLSQKPGVYEAYLACKDLRFIRLSFDDSMINVERVVIAMVAQLSKYRQEIIVGDALSQIRVVSAK